MAGRATARQPAQRPSRLEDGLREDFYDALAVVERSGVAALADSLTVTRARSGKPLGAPVRFDNRALLVCMLTSALYRRSTELATVYELVERFPDDLLAEIGLERGTDAHALSMAQLGHRWNRLAEAMNPSPVREGRRLAKDQDGRATAAPKPAVADPKCLGPGGLNGAGPVGPLRRPRRPSTRGLGRELAEGQAAQRARLLAGFVDRLLQACVPAAVSYRAVAVDWTDAPTAARSYSSRSTSADPDAAWGHRRPKASIAGARARRAAKATGRADGATRKARLDPRLSDLAPDGTELDKSERYYGYLAHFAVGVGDVDGPVVPELALSMRLAPANDMAGVAPALMDMLGSVLEGGAPLCEVIVDRGYSSRALGSVHVPMAERGLFLTFDYTQRQYGRHGTYLDAPLIGGRPHCPFTPESDVRLPGLGSSRADWAAYWRRRDALDHFAFRPLGRPVPELYQRFQCPAKAGRARCPFVPASLSLAHRAEVPDVGVLMADGQERLRCCGRSFVARMEVGLGWRQLHPHGSRAWVRSYDRRSAAERFNSSIKLEQQVDAMDIRVLGLAKRSLMIGFAAVATNIRHVRNWGRRPGS